MVHALLCGVQYMYQYVCMNVWVYIGVYVFVSPSLSLYFYTRACAHAVVTTYLPHAWTTADGHWLRRSARVPNVGDVPPPSSPSFPHMADAYILETTLKIDGGKKF